MLHERRPDSLTRTVSLLTAAALAYIPANLLPIMDASSLGHSEDDTILGGVAYFWTSGDWPLAVVVFVASVLVPILKLVALTLLTATVRRGSVWRRRERAGLYRLVERIGRWSMLDVFVVALTVTLVRLGSQTAPMQSDVQDAMQQLTRTLQSLNTLADYLERHPQALLFGKKGDGP